MSKRYRGYRRLTRTYPKQKWQLTLMNPPQVVFAPGTVASEVFYAIHKPICQTVVPTDGAANSVVSANNIVKVGNFKVKGSFSLNLTTASDKFLSMIIYVIFVPQGIAPDNTAAPLSNIASSLFYSHPEWVLGWTRLDCDSQGSDNFTISSRLKRNLNSGDSIQLGVMFINTHNSLSDINVHVHTTVQYAARAN